MVRFAGVLDGRLLRVVEGLYGAVRREPEESIFRRTGQPVLMKTCSCCAWAYCSF
jgi:hypothetical protein